MLPRDLKAEQFGAYPPMARQTAVTNIDLLRELPPAFVPFLLKEIKTLDLKFPAEQQELLDQLVYLRKLTAAERDGAMSAFAALRLPPALEAFDTVDNPAQFLERLSAHLWATSQIDAFRAASERYLHEFRAAYPEPQPRLSRLALVLIGQGSSDGGYRLFRKVRREGVLFNAVDGNGGLDQVLRVLETRAGSALASDRYAHWFIDGGETEMPASATLPLTFISYPQLADLRVALNARIKQAFETGISPEALRSELAATTPQSLGMHVPPGDECLDRFKVGLFTEGSGTQIYSTTFVQWTAREALRRARPVTLVTRYAPRQREASMADLLNARAALTGDPAGSLIDADMGAWYTWISLQRLTGADQSRFVVWFEGHNLAVAVGPRFARGSEDNKTISLHELLKQVAD